MLAHSAISTAHIYAQVSIQALHEARIKTLAADHPPG